MYLFICFFTIVATVSQVVSWKHDSGAADLKMMKQLLSGLKSSDESIDSEDVDHDLKEFFKHAAKKEEQYFKKMMREELSEEEKSQVKYYEDLLTKIKQVNDAKHKTSREEKEDLSYLRSMLQQVRDLKAMAFSKARAVMKRPK